MPKGNASAPGAGAKFGASSDPVANDRNWVSSIIYNKIGRV